MQEELGWRSKSEESVRRIIERSYRGGHSASERLVRGIYEKSTKNLFTALDFAESGIEVVRVYDNSELVGQVRQLLSFRIGRPQSVASETPAWLDSLFKGTKFEVTALRAEVKHAPKTNDRWRER